MLLPSNSGRASFLASCVLLFIALNEVSYSQDPKPKLPVLDPLPLIPAKPPEATVEEVIDSLEKVRKQKAVLEDQEKALIEQLRERLRDQKDRLSKLKIAGFSSPPQAAPKQESQKPGWAVESDASKFITLLGNPSFATRELAERQLLELGLKAKPTIQAGAQSGDAEVARRCTELLKRFRRTELADFRANKADWPTPTGTKFRSLVGDAPESRALFAKLMADDHRAAMIERAAADPQQAFQKYATQIRDMQKGGVSAFETFTGRLADQEMWSQYRDASRKAIAPEDLLAVLFLGSFPMPEGSVEPSEIDHVFRATFLELTGGTAKEPVCKLFAAWLNQRRHSESVLAGLEASLYGGIPDAVWVARRLVIDPKASSKVVGSAMAVLGHHGNISDLLALSRRREDTRVVKGGLAEAGTRDEVRVQDIAAVMALRLRRQVTENFRFSTSRWVGHWFGPDRPPFETLNYLAPDARPAILKEAWDWLDQQPDAPPKPKPGTLLGT